MITVPKKINGKRNVGLTKIRQIHGNNGRREECVPFIKRREISVIALLRHTLMVLKTLIPSRAVEIIMPGI